MNTRLQNLTSNSFLKFKCSVESEKLTVNFSYSLSLTPMIYLALCMDLLPMHGSVTLFIGHLRNISSLSYADSLNDDRFYHIISKSHIH